MTRYDTKSHPFATQGGGCRKGQTGGLAWRPEIANEPSPSWHGFG